MRTCFQLQLVGAADGVGHSCTAGGAADRLIHVTRFDAPISVASPVVLADAMTGDAGDALSNHRRYLQQAGGPRNLQLRANRRVTSNAKRTDRASGVLGHRLLEAMEHRRHGRVSMTARPPLFILARVAFAARLGRRITVLGPQLLVRIDRLRFETTGRIFRAVTSPGRDR